jgi:hypothetical protein
MQRSVASQASLHAPQLDGSVNTFWHCPPQHVRPTGHVALVPQPGAQMPSKHLDPGVQLSSPMQPMHTWFVGSQVRPRQSVSLAHPIAQRPSGWQ